jgi:hypothetical protein
MKTTKTSAKTLNVTQIIENVGIENLLNHLLLNITTLQTFEGAKTFRTKLSAQIKTFEAYEAPAPKAEHLVYKSAAIQRVMLAEFGLIGAFNRCVSMINSNDIEVQKMCKSTVKDNQLAFAMVNFEQCKHFMSAELSVKAKFSPQDILNTFIKAATMLQSSYAKHVLTFGSLAQKASAKASATKARATKASATKASATKASATKASARTTKASATKAKNSAKTAQSAN